MVKDTYLLNQLCDYNEKVLVVPWFNDEPRFKWMLMHTHPITLPDAVLYE